MINDTVYDGINFDDLFASYPHNQTEVSEKKKDKINPAIRLYGLRLYKDQTPIEYLAEFFLVFASPKKQGSDNGIYSFHLEEPQDGKFFYYPEDRLALKLFSFFPSSKQETRHAVHRAAYLNALSELKKSIKVPEEEKEETVRLIQSLFSGFVGVAKNRTWVTHSYLPASNCFLARELDWLHSQAKKDTDLSEPINQEEEIAEKWGKATKYFATDRHNFMARGGELLYLQLANLANSQNTADIDNIYQYAEYSHLNIDSIDLIKKLEVLLKRLLKIETESIEKLAGFVEKVLGNVLNEDEGNIKKEKKRASLGWVPVASRIEAFLFAFEMNNICSSSLALLEKIDLLKILCCMQVLRSMCFQARRVDGSEKKTYGFVGNYAWIATDPEAKSGTPVRKMAQSSFNHIEAMLYRVLRNNKVVGGSESFSATERDKHGFEIFRKITKEIGLVIPPKGADQRFALHQGLLRFLVSALLRPGERIRLTSFYERVFAHYGIALGNQQLVEAILWSGNEVGSESYAVSTNTVWIEEALQQGGFLVELSDAVSIVVNPG